MPILSCLSLGCLRTVCPLRVTPMSRKSCNDAESANDAPNLSDQARPENILMSIYFQFMISRVVDFLDTLAFNSLANAAGYMYTHSVAKESCFSACQLVISLQILNVLRTPNI